MSMVVRSNMNAMNANRNLSINNGQVAKSLEKLASGYAINRAGDDASGLAISEKMKAQIKGLEQASNNSQDGISLVQTAEGGMNEIHDMLNRMVELATKSANGTIQDDVDRDAIQSEVNALRDEIDRIADATNFNGIELLNGNMDGGKTESAGIVEVELAAGGGATPSAATAASAAKPTFTAGAIGDTITVTIAANIDGENKFIEIEFDSAAATATDAEFKAAAEANSDFAAAFDIDTNGNIVSKDDTGTDQIISVTGTSSGAGTVGGGAVTAGVTESSSVASLAEGDKFTVGDKTFVATTDSSKGGTTDADGGVYVYGDGSATKDLSNAMSNALNAAGANTSVDAAGALVIDTSKDTTATAGAGKSLTLQVGDTAESFNMVSVSIESMKTTSLGVDAVDVSTQTGSQEAIDTIKDAINMVSTNRANLGALQNRLEYTINNLDNTAENMTSANSTIRDTDMASEMMEYTKMNVLTQSAQSMLAQANQAPQQILSLLG